MKKIAAALLCFSLLAPPAHAINLLERLLYKEAVIKFYNVKVLVAPLTGEVKYVWCGNPANGYWMPVSGKVRQQYQAMYERQRE